MESVDVRVDVVPVDDVARVDDGDWVSVSDLARKRGVSRQAISKRVKALAGRLATRGEGKSFRFHRPTFERIAAAHDPAQDIRNRRSKANRIEGPSEARSVGAADQPAPNGYDDAATREKMAKAELAAMELARKRAELVLARDIEGAAIKVATTIAQHIVALKSKAGQLYAAGHKGGEKAIQVVLTEAVDSILRNVSDAMRKLAKEELSNSDSTAH